MYHISNEILNIQIAAKGAELQSIYHNQNKLEYLWSGDEKYWAKKSPVLFPIVGGLKNNSYNYKDIQYQLSRHGFARESNFIMTDQTGNAITFILRSSEKTKSVYPFDFVFSIKYTLHGNSLTVSLIVENTGHDDMLFSAGAHPAFALPVDKNLDYEDYYLLFSRHENACRWPLSAQGLIEKEPVQFLENENKLPLKKDLFYNDAIVLKHLQSNAISILSDQSAYGIKVSVGGFPYMGIWAARDADFVCIEPWCGIADSVEATGRLAEKEGIIKLPAGKVFEKNYTIEVF